MEKLTYAQLVRLGDSEECSITDSTNDWYLIKQSEGGGDVEMAWVFEDVSRPNLQSPALLVTNFEVIGSCIYAIGGISIKSGHPYCVNNEGSNMIHFIDTRNPKDGWRTRCTLPFIISRCQSAVVDDQWLYMFGGKRCNICPALDYTWGYAVNVSDSKQVRKINPPGNSPGFPIFATCLSPGTLVASLVGESAWYQLDCKNNTWTVYQEESPYPARWLRGCITVVDDGILYIYDIRNKKELHVVDLPNSIWFPRQVFVQFVVLSKNRFCIMWHMRWGVTYVDVEEKRIFLVVGDSLLNVVLVNKKDYVRRSTWRLNKKKVLGEGDKEGDKSLIGEGK